MVDAVAAVGNNLYRGIRDCPVADTRDTVESPACSNSRHYPVRGRVMEKWVAENYHFPVGSNCHPAHNPVGNRGHIPKDANPAIWDRTLVAL